MRITVCDVCQTKEGVEKVWLPYDRKMDAAGSMEDVGETFDLCCKCYLRVLRFRVLQEARTGRIDKWAFNKKLIEDIKGKISR